VSREVVAIILAAGASRRMGTPKMVLPWGNRTVVGQVVSVLEDAGVDEILVVTGGAELEIRQALQLHRVHLVKNEGFMAGDMLSSVQTGLTAALDGSAQAALIVLGDQPQIQTEVVKALLLRWQTASPAIIIPSIQIRRGHPMLLARSLWQEVLDLPLTQSLRDFLRLRNDWINYLPVETDSILQDLDTPEDYARQKPL